MLVVKLAVGLRWKGLSQKTEKIERVFPFIKRPLLRAKLLHQPKANRSYYHYTYGQVSFRITSNTKHVKLRRNTCRGMFNSNIHC
jgi:hypothetical protein